MRKAILPIVISRMSVMQWEIAKELTKPMPCMPPQQGKTYHTTTVVYHRARWPLKPISSTYRYWWPTMS